MLRVRSEVSPFTSAHFEPIRERGAVSCSSLNLKGFTRDSANKIQKKQICIMCYSMKIPYNFRESSRSTNQTFFEMGGKRLPRLLRAETAERLLHLPLIYNGINRNNFQPVGISGMCKIVALLVLFVFNLL